ncbi:MAG: mycofactocin glycosyltransferase [Frankiaceae bacterium]|nr:mycofactocin glycosyltransferase [Frankiaceae bacterium]
MKLVPDPDTSSYDGGRLLLGGSPRRVLRLTDRGAARARALLAGSAVTDAVDAALVRRLLAAGFVHPVPPPPSPLGGDVAVVVPAYGSQPVAAPPRAVVVDDGSPSPLAGATVRLPVNRGPAAARNAGLAATAAPIVAFVDSDVAVSADTLGRLAAMLDDDPALGAVAPRILPAGTRLDMGPRPGVVRPGARTPYVPSTVLVVRRIAVEAVGGFDESLRVGEDVDLVWRLAAAGWVVRYVPELEAVHQEPATRVARWDRSRRYGTAAGPLAGRHPAAPLSPRVPAVAAVLLAAAGRPLLASAALAGPVLPVARRLRSAGIPPSRAAAVGTAAATGPAASAARWLVQLWSPVLGVLVIRAVRRRDPVALVALAAMLVRRDIVDEVAYGAGVWTGCFRARALRPLVPWRVAATKIH